MLIEHEIQEFFIHNRLTLALAESCTGGAASARLVQLPDCSRYFLGSIVSYAGSAKQHLLGVQSSTLSTFGEVSLQTAEEMAQGALKQFGSDYALAITGIAGPTGGSYLKPLGTVCFSLASHTRDLASFKKKFHGDRKAIIEKSVEAALHYLWKYVSTNVYFSLKDGINP